MFLLIDLLTKQSIEVKVVEVFDTLQTLVLVNYVSKELLWQRDVDWVVSRRVHEPPDAESEVEWLLAELLQDDSRTASV